MRSLVLLSLTLLLAGCAGYADAPPGSDTTVTAPALTAVSAGVPDAVRAQIPRLASQSIERHAKQLTVRVRNISCEGIATGSGFALDSDILVTNRHVLAGADRLEVSTWDGRSLNVTFAEVGVLGDLGVVVVDGHLPEVGRFGDPPAAEDSVTAVGYPLGGPLTLSPGTVVDRVDGASLGIEGPVVRLTSQVQPGNSGGPLLDRKGRVVGIVYAIERATGFGLAIPVDTLRGLVRAGGLEDIPACGSD
jgi:S1-C subfamily serine protease